MVDTLRGSVKISSVPSDSRQSLHATASVSRLAKTASATGSIPAAQQLPAAWRRLILDQLVSPSADQHMSSAAVTAEVHQPLHTASEAELTITRTDASLQLANLEFVSSKHQMMAANAAKWDAVQTSAAASDAQLHAVATMQQADQQRVVSSTLLFGPAAALSIQGVELRQMLSGNTSGELPEIQMPVDIDTNSTVDQAQHTESPPLAGSSADEMLVSVQAQILSSVTRLLDTDIIGQDEPLMAAGLDSLGATELVQSLQSVFDISLPATMVFDYPTIAAMAAFISQQLVHSTQQGPYAQAGAVALPGMALVPEAATGSDVALITGVAGDEKLLQQWTSGDAITRVPHSRWDTLQQAKTSGSADTLAPQFGSFLSNVDQFDSTLFGIMASEALTMDPQQRLLLQTALGVIPGGPSGVRGRAVGAYVGIGTSDYNTLMQQSQVPFNAFSFTAGSASVASGRLAFAFGLQGPTASIDTACSASLVAAHMACQSFRWVYSANGSLLQLRRVI